MGPDVVQRPYFRIATTAPDAVMRGGHGPYGGLDPDGVGGHAGDHGADGEPAVAPEPVHTDGAGPPARWATSPTAARSVG
jgi:hypothetical protein